MVLTGVLSPSMGLGSQRHKLHSHDHASERREKGWETADIEGRKERGGEVGGSHLCGFIPRSKDETPRSALEQEI